MRTNILIILAVLASILGMIGIFMLYSKISGKTISPIDSKPEAKFSEEDLSLHNSVSNCWIVHRNKIYDVTLFINSYEDAEMLKEDCGRESENFEKLSPYLKEIITSYKIGALENRYAVSRTI